MRILDIAAAAWASAICVGTIFLSVAPRDIASDQREETTFVQTGRLTIPLLAPDGSVERYFVAKVRRDGYGDADAAVPFEAMAAHELTVIALKNRVLFRSATNDNQALVKALAARLERRGYLESGQTVSLNDVGFYQR